MSVDETKHAVLCVAFPLKRKKILNNVMIYHVTYLSNIANSCMMPIYNH